MTEPERPEPPFAGGEREQLTGFLDFLRATVVWKCTGLTDEQARARHVPSEHTTIAGLVGHLTYVEQIWFEVRLDGRPNPWRDAFAVEPDAEFRATEGKSLATLVAEYEQQCETGRKVAAGLALTDEVDFRGEKLNLRWVLIHMIEETGRHAGHLDLLRELTDGSTGE